jgi:hypothetical protein
MKHLTLESTIPSTEFRSQRSSPPYTSPPRPPFAIPLFTPLTTHHSPQITTMRTSTGLIIATATFAGLNLAASIASSLQVSCLVNHNNDPAGSPPTSCTQSSIPITYETCFSSCTCTPNAAVSCNGFDSTYTRELLMRVFDGYWICECEPPCLCPNGEPCSMGCGLGL